MIDEKKLIKELSKNSVFEKITNAEGKNVFEIIKTQPQVSGWTPVTERLPENGCGVLVTVNGKHNNITFVDALEIAEYDGDFGWIVEGYPQWTDPNVTAWQPLPEPFEGREEECL